MTTTTPRSARRERTFFSDAEAALALLTLFLIGARIFLGSGVSIGQILALALLPLWLPRLVSSWTGLWLAISAAFATISGIWLTAVASQDHDSSTSTLIATTLLFLSVPMIAGIVVWAQRFVPLWVIGVTFGLGMVAAAVMRPSTFAENPWKFAVGLPIAVIALSITMRPHKRLPDMLALAALALVSVIMDSRAFFGVFTIVLLLLVWQAMPRISNKRMSAAKVLVWAAAIGVTVYVIGTSLLVEGYLGQEAQARSVEQQERAGSVLVGGRPELAATAALFLHRPLGFGAGTIASPSDILVAKSGMQVINYDPNNGYVENFMFGPTKFELHSMTGDLWAYFGWPAVIFLAIAVVVMIRRVAVELARGTATALLLFAVIITAWNLFFNPIYSSAPFFGLALGLALAGPHLRSEESTWREAVFRR
ncbi:hypothetical protein [Microbacterium sp. 1.5R]|uniref:hypothetical protein n=1 Tax=Microbacterium sp. 1.5R TaxID=1916917 RepID=UPI0011A38282|nr:hypothetical protein [Microbacterium sp. 1.5R]